MNNKDRELVWFIAKELMDCELLAVGWFGDPETETLRQVELKNWLDEVGIEFVGEYLVNVEQNWWKEGWNPLESADDLEMVKAKARERWPFMSVHFLDGYFVCEIANREHVCKSSKQAETEARAVCLAIKAAIEAETPQARGRE